MKRKTFAARLIEEGIKKLTLTVPAVTYQDGEGGTVFGSQTTLCLSGGRTPPFIGTPKRPGCIFKGWFPEVAKTVTGDAVYTARWEKIPDCSISYIDGTDDPPDALWSDGWTSPSGRRGVAEEDDIVIENRSELPV